jgi:hypothetical protein
LIDIGNTTTLAAVAIEGAVGFTTSSLYLVIFNLLAETASSLQVLDMLLVEIDDEDMRVFQPSYALPHFASASPCIFSYI